MADGLLNARLKMRPVFLLVLLTAAAASAQGVSLKYSFQDATSYTFNASSCSGKVQVTWTSTIATLGYPCTELKLWSTAGSCGDAPGASDVKYTSVSATDVLSLRTDSFDVPLGELPGFQGTDAGTVCGTEAAEVAHQLCGAISLPNGTGGACTVSQASSLTLTYDTKPPAAPSIDSVGQQDSALKVTVTAQTDTVVVHVDVRAQGTAEYKEKGKILTASATSVTIPNLTNGTTYDVQARAEDAAGNISAPSEPMPGTPRRTLGLWARYTDAGGGQRGGCAATDGLPLLIAGGLWLLRRKRG